MRWLLILLLIPLTACGVLGRSVEDCAADYYNFMVGRSPKVAYSSFLSPGYRGTMQPEAREKYDAAMFHGQRANDRFPEVTATDVLVAREGKFAITVLRPGLGSALSGLAPVRWVQDSRRWFLYLGVDVELGRYGVFPETLAAPSPDQPESEGSDDATEQDSSDGITDKGEG